MGTNSELDISNFLESFIPEAIEEYKGKCPKGSAYVDQLGSETLELVKQYFPESIETDPTLYQSNVEKVIYAGAQIKILLCSCYIQEYGFTEEEKKIHSDIPDDTEPKDLRRILTPLIQEKEQSYLWRMLDENFHALASQIDNEHKDKGIPSFLEYLEANDDLHMTNYINEGSTNVERINK